MDSVRDMLRRSVDVRTLRSAAAAACVAGRIMERRASLRGVQLGVVQLEVGRVAASTLERCGVVSSATVRHVHAAVSSSAPAGDDAAQHAAAELQSLVDAVASLVADPASSAASGVDVVMVPTAELDRAVFVRLPKSLSTVHGVYLRQRARSAEGLATPASTALHVVHSLLAAGLLRVDRLSSALLCGVAAGAFFGSKTYF